MKGVLNLQWDDEISILKTVGEVRQKKFNKMGIYTIRDLLIHYPREYADRSQLTKINDLKENEEHTFVAKIVQFAEVFDYGKIKVVKVLCCDETSVATLVWYNQIYLAREFAPNQLYLITGKLQLKYQKLEIAVSDFEKIEQESEQGKIIPIYASGQGITQKLWRNVMEDTLKQQKESQLIEEDLPLWIREEFDLVEKDFAMEQIHFPKTEANFYQARMRLVFDEFFILQTSLQYLKQDIGNELKGKKMKKIRALKEIEEALPYELTKAQKNTILEIKEDMKSGKTMNRLIQGDVGSGKTAVAMIVAFWVIQNGYQVVLMVPTELLAQQHYETIQAFYESYGIQTVLLTGTQKAKERNQILKQIENGEASMIIGTHAVIQTAVSYHNIGLVITDEQHRFGVQQRGALSQKGDNPHILVMTATPIPRTLAIMIYGELDISIIDELPPNRKPIETIATTSKAVKKVRATLKSAVKKGRQAYVVCPAVEENGKIEMQSVIQYTETLSQHLPDCKIRFVHGKMKPKEKKEVMELFVKGDIDILVSTTVIEVGINVPNATIMVIENAERFGLAQLHQLRGRVGRGAEQSHCILVSDLETEVAQARIQAMVQSSDGFHISEVDLQLRGPGEFFGTMQHGVPEFRIANIYQDMSILLKAQKATKRLFEQDFQLEKEEHQAFKERMNHFIQNKILEL